VLVDCHFLRLLVCGRELDGRKIGALSGRVVDSITKGSKSDRLNERKDERGDGVMRGNAEAGTAKGRG
jgi:hypothetical protein